MHKNVHFHVKVIIFLYKITEKHSNFYDLKEEERNMFKITSANGISTANQDIVPVMRAFTTLDGTDDTIKPFRPASIYLECDALTNVKINGENSVFLLQGADGAYTIDFGRFDILVNKLEIVNAGINWRATFLF